jgi:hypothetical protein
VERADGDVRARRENAATERAPGADVPRVMIRDVTEENAIARDSICCSWEFDSNATDEINLQGEKRDRRRILILMGTKHELRAQLIKRW